MNQLNQGIETVKVEAPLGKSDHATITVELKAKIKHKYNIENKLNFYKTDFISIQFKSDYATITVELKPETKHKYNNEIKLNY